MPREKNGVENSTLSPVLTRNTLKRMAGPVYFGRGEGYFESRLVKGLVEFEGRITANVRGTEKYDVSLWPETRMEDGGLDHSCTCPLGEDGEFCKHCVAVGLEWLEQQKDGGGKKKAKVNFKDLSDYLLAQDKQILTKIILEQAKKDDRLRQGLLTKAARASSKGLDLEAFRGAIDHALEFEGYVDYRSMGDYAGGVEDAVDSIADLLEEGYAIEVMGLAEYALAEVEGAIEHTDDSDGDMGEILHRLEEIHLSACKKARPDAEELARRLFHWESNSPWDVFSNAAETYAKVFGKKGLAVYRELARTEWERLPELRPGDDDSERWGGRYSITRVMESLARQSGDIDELVKVKSRDLSNPWCFLQIAEVYRKARRFDKALEWAERGVKSFPRRPDSSLQKFLAEEYHRAGRHNEAMTQVWAIFTNSPGLDRYKLLKTHADKTGEWATWREKALTLISERLKKAGKGRDRRTWHVPDGSVLVEIFLWEKDIEAAWHAARQHGCSDRLWLELARKREKEFPEDALDIYRRRVEPTIGQKNNLAYKEAVGYIKKVSTLMKRLGKREEFLEYMEFIRASHKRKRNFIKVLDRAEFS